MENPIKMDDLGVPLFSETSKFWVVIFQAFFFWSFNPPEILGKIWSQFDPILFQRGWKHRPELI